MDQHGDGPQPGRAASPDRGARRVRTGQPIGMRPPGIRFGRILGVPLQLTVPWLLLSVLIAAGYGWLVLSRRADTTRLMALLAGVGLVACLLVSVLLHELGHAVAARRAGLGVRHIALDLLGGHTELEEEAPRPGTDAVVALAGPAVSLLLGLASLLSLRIVAVGSLGHELAFQLALSNLVVAGYNVLPGLPLDGGRALRAAVWAATGRREHGELVAGWAGRAVAVGTLAAGVAGYLSGWFTLLGVAIAGLVAVSLWAGATHAVRWARLARRAPLVCAGGLARDLWVVPAGTPLSEALRMHRANVEAAGGSLGVVDPAGELFAVVDPAAADAVPESNRPWVAVESVARGVDARRMLPAELSGLDLLRTVGSDPDALRLVRLGEGRVGVLRVAELVDVLRTGK